MFLIYSFVFLSSLLIKASEKFLYIYYMLRQNILVYRRRHKKKPYICQIMCFSIYCMNGSIEGRRID